MSALESGDQGEHNGGGAATIWSPELALASPTTAAHGGQLSFELQTSIVDKGTVRSVVDKVGSASMDSGDVWRKGME
jgi:hypothetical protein